MCIDPEMSERRLRRRKADRKFRRIKRNLGHSVTAVRGWADIRPRLAARAARNDILDDAGLLISAPTPATPAGEPEAFTTTRRLARDAAHEQALRDAEDARRFAREFPYANLDAA